MSTTALLLETDRLLLRNWREEDREFFHHINSDPDVMRYFPFRRDRSESDRILDILNQEIEAYGFGFCALERKSDGQCVGFCGLHRCSLEPILKPGTIEIGWRLARPFWGNGYATEAGHAWIEHAFNQMHLDQIVSFAVHDNHASTAVMKRLGLRAKPQRDFNHPGVPEDRPELRHHVFYEIIRKDWFKSSILASK